MKKTMMFLFTFSVLLSLFGCKSQNFQFADIGEITDVKCMVSVGPLDESKQDASGGIDDGSGAGDSSIVIEDPVIKDAYSLISENSVLISGFEVENEDTLLYLTFYSGNIDSAKTTDDGAICLGSFVITKTGRFIAKSALDANKSYYYQGDEDLYNKIVAIIAKCAY